MLGGELIGRTAAQTCRQPGLSIVYMELPFDFGGDEPYFHTDEAWPGASSVKR